MLSYSKCHLEIEGKNSRETGKAETRLLIPKWTAQIRSPFPTLSVYLLFHLPFIRQHFLLSLFHSLREL